MNNIENWEIEFEETSPLALSGREWAKSFIKKTLASHQLELEKKVLGKKQNPPPFPVEEGIANEAMQWGAKFGYNQAIDDTLSILKGEDIKK